MKYKLLQEKFLKNQFCNNHNLKNIIKYNFRIKTI